MTVLSTSIALPQPRPDAADEWALSDRGTTGVALAGPSVRVTPVALTTPKHVTMDFDITWDADQAHADIVGECG